MSEETVPLELGDLVTFRDREWIIGACEWSGGMVSLTLVDPAICGARA